MTNTPAQLPPRLGTQALLEYLWSSACDIRLFHFTIDIVLRADYFTFVAKQALEGSDDYKAITPVDLAAKAPGALTTKLRQSRQELLEMFFSRAVDNFQIYLVDVIRLALQKEPRILSERRQELSLGHILQFESIQALARSIVESKLSSLAYEGFGATEKWCRDKTIPLMVTDQQRAKIVELIALRNIIVHTRGRVDDRYMAAVPSSSLQIGQKRELAADDLFGAIGLLESFAAATDRAIADKFSVVELEVQNELTSRTSERRGFGQEKSAIENAPNAESAV
jgi:uncharacterized protein YutE (UPF0331/DUF86 family)